MRCFTLTFVLRAEVVKMAALWHPFHGAVGSLEQLHFTARHSSATFASSLLFRELCDSFQMMMLTHQQQYGSSLSPAATPFRRSHIEPQFSVSVTHHNYHYGVMMVT
jgi:hypothetical protein